MELASSDAAAILFFLRKRKKRMGAQKYFKVLSTKECGMLKPELLKSV